MHKPLPTHNLSPNDNLPSAAPTGCKVWPSALSVCNLSERLDAFVSIYSNPTSS